MAEKLPRSYLFTWIMTVAFTFVPLLNGTHREEYLNFLPGLLSIIFLVIIDQYNSSDQRAKFTVQMLAEFRGLHEAVLLECQRAILDSRMVSTFSLMDAQHYVAANAIRAKRIHNTRLGDSEIEAKNPGYMTARNLQDDGFIKAVQRGHEYNLVYDVTHEENVSEFLKRVDKQHGSRHAGLVRISPVDARGMPLLQFMVLEYQDHKECLIGYGLGGEITSSDIYLIRSAILCDYLQRVYESYARMLAPKAP
jgi:hypothetical protein